MALTRPRSSQLLDSDFKQSVRAATTASVTLSGGAPSTVDTTVSLAVGDRILVKDQSTASQNGIYVVQTVGTGSNGTWTRASDFDTSLKISSGLQVYVEEGTESADRIYALTTDNPITLGSTSLTFTRIGGGGLTPPGGSTGSVQYNVSNVFTGSANLTFDNVNLVVAGYTQSGNIKVGSSGNTISSTDTNGNINLTPNGSGVVLSSANITAPVFISNIGSGTAPFVVTSTTQVANLNVAAAGTATSATTAGTVTTAAQPNITSVGNLTIANIDNIQINNNSIIATDTDGNLQLQANGTGKILVSGLTSGRFVLATTSGGLTDSSAFTYSGSDAIFGGNVKLNAQGDLRFADSDSSNWVAFQAPATVASDVTWTLPGADGTANQVLATYGNGTLYWYSVSTTSISNGTSNVSVAASGNVTTSVAGTSDVITVTSTGANISGYANITGNANIGNIGTAGQIISTLTTGTAPFTVTSTTQVANLNVATAGTAGTVTTAAQPNITSVGTLTSLTSSGTISAGGRLASTASAGDEGGEITLALASANTTLNSNVTIDIYQNKLRIFEGGGTNRGAFIDLTAASTGVGSNLLAGGGGTPTEIANGTTSISTLSSANATVSIAGTSNVVVFTSTGANVTGYVTASGTITGDIVAATNNNNGTNFKVGDDAWIGDINLADTIRIKGQQNSANAYIVFGDGDATALGRASTGALTYGGNFAANGTITGTRLISNIATGTAPLTVTSTTQVANLNVATAGSSTTAGTVTTAAQPNITSVGTLTGLTVGGDVTLNAQGDLRFADSDSSNWVAFQSPATVAANVTWTLPSTDGTASQALVTNGSGVLSWASAGSSVPVGGSTDKIFWENDQAVTTDYTITAAKNAMSAGVITVNSGAIVTVASGTRWIIVG